MHTASAPAAALCFLEQVERAHTQREDYNQPTAPPKNKTTAHLSFSPSPLLSGSSTTANRCLLIFCCCLTVPLVLRIFFSLPPPLTKFGGSVVYLFPCLLVFFLRVRVCFTSDVLPLFGTKAFLYLFLATRTQARTRTLTLSVW